VIYFQQILGIIKINILLGGASLLNWLFLEFRFCIMNNYSILAIILCLKVFALPLIAIFLYCLYVGLSFEMEMQNQSSHRGKRRR
jgi:hypothetical protein